MFCDGNVVSKMLQVYWFHRSAQKKLQPYSVRSPLSILTWFSVVSLSKYFFFCHETGITMERPNVQFKHNSKGDILHICRAQLKKFLQACWFFKVANTNFRWKTISIIFSIDICPCYFGRFYWFIRGSHWRIQGGRWRGCQGSAPHFGKISFVCAVFP